MDSVAKVCEFEAIQERVGEMAVFAMRYRVVLMGIWPVCVPDRVTLEVFGEKVPLLITKGKPRCCFLCGSCSHMQAACPTPYCRYCKRSRHVATTAHGSVSSKTGSKEERRPTSLLERLLQQRRLVLPRKTG